jgi:hypothetical protein
MTPSEILAAISWAPGTDPAVRQQVEDAIIRLGGSNAQPVFDEMGVHHRLEKFVAAKGTANKAAEALGISKSFMHDIRAGHRPVPDSVLHALEIERVRTKALFRDR